MTAKKKIARIVAVVVLLTAGGASAALFLQPQTSAEKSTFHGNVDIRDMTLAFRVAGRVQEVLKTEGDQVHVGDVVAVLDARPFELELAGAQAALAVAEAQLETVEAGARREDISQARSQLAERQVTAERARDQLERVRRLAATGAMTEVELLDAQATFDQRKAAVQAAEAALSKLVNGARSEELLVAHAQLAQAQAAVDVARLHLEDTKLRSLSEGVVTTRAIEPGTMVQPGSPALVLSMEEPKWIRAYASQAELARLAPGTVVEVSTDGRPNEPYRGTVGHVSPQAEFTPKNVETEELRTSLVYRFRVVVEGEAPGLRQGMPVRVRIAETPEGGS